MMVAAADFAAHGPQDLCSRKFSAPSVVDSVVQFNSTYQAVWTISSKVMFPLFLMFFFASFCVLVVPWRPWCQGRGGRHHRRLGLFRMASSTVILRPFHNHLPSWCHHQPFLETGRGGRSWGPGQMWHQIPLRCTSYVRFWSHWDRTQVAWWRQLVSDELGFRLNKESCTLASSELKEDQSFL